MSGRLVGVERWTLFREEPQRMMFRVLGVFGLAATLACTTGESDSGSRAAAPGSAAPPSCEELGLQYAACAGATAEQKQAFASLCRQPRFTEACRRCLDGRICGDTQACDASCGK